MGIKDRTQSTRYVIEKRTGKGGKWEPILHPACMDEEQALRTHTEVRGFHFRHLEDLFYNIKTPEDARAAADEYERREQTDFRIVKQTIISEEYIPTD